MIKMEFPSSVENISFRINNILWDWPFSHFKEKLGWIFIHVYVLYKSIPNASNATC